MAWNLQEAATYYRSQGAPGDQNALVALLREIQQEQGGTISPDIPEALAVIYGIKASYIGAIIRRIPSLRLGDGHVLELCAGPNCGKHTALAARAEAIAAASGGKIRIKFVPCMRMCAKGPNLKWDGKLYHGATEALLKELTK